MANFLRGVREWATPALKETAFLERGVLTPAEFVAAGDQLVYRCPTWEWATGDPAKVRPHLPPEKQYLVTRRAPCRQRVANLNNTVVTDLEGEEDGEWLATHTTGNKPQQGEEDIEEIEEIGATPPPAAAEEVTNDMTNMTVDPPKGPKIVVDDDGDEYEDMATFEEDILEADDSAVAVPESTPATTDDDLLKTRTYDVSITYDKYYQTPRVWLSGFDENGQPLTRDQTFEDIIKDYVNRTVTFDPHPHLNHPHASIHPCKHAIVMKQIVDSLCEGGTDPDPDQYLFIFLKFINSVVPTIEYDFTMEVKVKGNEES